MPPIPEDRAALILSLNKIGEARFETLLGILNVPTEYLSGKSAGLAIRVSDLIRWAEAPGGCEIESIRQALAKIPPTNPLETPSPIDEGLLDQYRKKLEKAIGTARFYGLPDRPLEKVFVELTVIEDFEIPRDAEYKALMDKELRRRRTLFPKDETEEDNPEETDEEDRRRPRKVRRTVKPEELLEAGKRSQVVGAPGCGKTTLLRWLALQTAQTSDRLPVFIELKALKKAQFDTIDDDFSGFLFQQGVKRRFDKTDLTAEQFSALETVFCEYYKAGRLVVLLDGLDEIAESERHRLRTAVENYASHHEGGLTLIVSTRPYGYLRNFADLKAMEIEPLSDIQIGQFLDHWCEKPIADNVKASLRKNPNLRGLARFPFLLAFIAHLNSAGDITRIDLYQRIVEQLIVEIDKEKGVERFKLDDPFGATKRDFLRKVAFDGLFEGDEKELSNRLVFTRDAFLKAAKEFVRNENLTISPAHLVFDVCATPLLREVENQRYAFAHLTIQEFLVAEELSTRDDCHKLFIQALFNRQLAEMEVLPMTIGLAGDPNEFYQLLSKTPESFDFIRLRLEARSLGYHQKAAEDAFNQERQSQLTDIGLGKIASVGVFLGPVFQAIRGINTIHSENFISGFLAGLSDPNWQVRQRAVQAIEMLGNYSPKVIRKLSETLGDKNIYTRQLAIDVLYQIGSASPEAIRALSDSLCNQNWPLHPLPAYALVKLGHATPKVIRELSLRLDDDEIFVRDPAAEALIKIGQTSHGVIRKLIISTFSHFLQGQEEDFKISVRITAAKALAKLSHSLPNAIRVLSKALRHQDYSVRWAAAEGLGETGKASPQVLRALHIALHDKDYSVSQSAAEALGKLGITSPKVIPILTKALCNRNAAVRQNATNALGKLGNSSPKVIRALTNTLDDKDWLARAWAATALGKLGNAAPNIISALSKMLRDRQECARECAADALGKLGNTSPDIIRALTNALRDKNADVRRSAAKALVQIGNASPDAIQALSNALRDKNANVRQNAAGALGALGNASPDVIHTLAEALQDQNSSVRRSAADALGELGNALPDVIRALAEALHDQDRRVRLGAIQALVHFGNTSPNIIRSLCVALCNKDYKVRQLAAEALTGLNDASPGIIPVLTNALRDQDEFVRKCAAEALGKLGNSSPKVIRALTNTLDDKDWLVRARAAEALGELGNNSQQVINAISKKLRDRDEYVREEATNALGKIGNIPPNCIRLLFLALRDKNRDVRQSAAEALERIGFDSPVFCEGLKLLLFDPDPELQKIALRSIGYPSTDPGLLDDLKKLTESDNPEISEAAEDAYNKYKFKLEMLGLLPA